VGLAHELHIEDQSYLVAHRRQIDRRPVKANLPIHFGFRPDNVQGVVFPLVILWLYFHFFVGRVSAQLDQWDAPIGRITQDKTALTYDLAADEIVKVRVESRVVRMCPNSGQTTGGKDTNTVQK